MSLESLFVVSVVLLAYTYVGYPALAFACAWLGARPRHAGPIEPTVSVVIVGYNEVARIARRIDNLLSLDYPADRLEILLGSDGSSDGTAEVARAYEHAGVGVIAFEARRGKAAVLNDLVPKAAGEIVVLADVRQQFDAGALRALVAPFADPRIGAVSGELILTQNADGTAVGEGIGFYWRYEKFIRRHEARLDSTVGATGAIYAIRRELFEPIAEDTILDDVLIPARIARRGYRVLFEPGARAYDRAAATADEEFTRKVRTIAGKFQLLAREAWLLSPFHNRLWMQTVSHHGLRLLTPVFLATAAGSNLFLLGRPFYRWTLLGQVAFYAAALAGQRLRHGRRKIPFVAVPYVISLLAWATVVAFLKYVSGRQHVTWEKASA
jgi:cellulose synthase/poly-beta-1,6-N-acetylglucosamine synthase-like glycosyltransferase